MDIPLDIIDLFVDLAFFCGKEDETEVKAPEKAPHAHVFSYGLDDVQYRQEPPPAFEMQTY